MNTPASTSNITLRPASRSDIPALARIANAANAHSALHHRMAPHQAQHPLDYHHWRLNITRERFATPNLRTIVAVDSATGVVLGQASWAVENDAASSTPAPLHERWVRERQHPWADWCERSLLWVEKTWARRVAGRPSIDHALLDSFMAAFAGPAAHAGRPACLHLELIVVDPTVQARGVGRSLLLWGKELAVRENLPVFLEALVEAVGFYEREGFERLSEDLVVEVEGREEVRVPRFVWEGKGTGREGRWLVRDERFKGEGEGEGEGKEVRWRWRDKTQVS